MHVFFYRGQGTLDDMLKQWRSHIMTCKDHSIFPIVVFDGRKLKGKAEEYKKREAAVKRKHVMLDEHTAKVDALLKDVHVRVVSGIIIPKYISSKKDKLEDGIKDKDKNDDKIEIITYPKHATSVEDEDEKKGKEPALNIHLELGALARRKQQCATIPRDFFKETETMLVGMGIDIRHAPGSFILFFLLFDILSYY